MRKNLQPKPYLYPLPVLIIGTYDESGVPNAMNAAWGTVCDMIQVLLVLSANHKTTKNLLLKKESEQIFEARRNFRIANGHMERTKVLNKCISQLKIQS